MRQSRDWIHIHQFPRLGLQIFSVEVINFWLGHCLSIVSNLSRYAQLCEHIRLIFYSTSVKLLAHHETAVDRWAAGKEWSSYMLKLRRLFLIMTRFVFLLVAAIPITVNGQSTQLVAQAASGEIFTNVATFYGQSGLYGSYGF